MRLQVEFHAETNVRVLRCLGSIIFGPEVEYLRSRLAELLDQGYCLILNLTQVQRIDAGGLGLLAWLSGEMSTRSRPVKLVCASKRMRELLQITHLLRRLEVYSTEAAAFESCLPLA